MTLDITKPADQVVVSEIPTYIREDRVAINSVSGGGNVGATTLEVPLASTALAIPTQLGIYGHEIVLITAAGAVTLTQITGGTAGQLKTFIFLDGLISLTDNSARANATFDLNQAPADSDYAVPVRTVLTLVNVGGDAGATSDGYWREVDRAESS